MFIVNVTIQVLPSAIDDFVRATRLNHEGTRQEPGNLRFDVAQAIEDPTRFLLYEVYRAPEDFTDHQATEHYKIWKAAVQPLDGGAAGGSQVPKPVSGRCFMEVSGERSPPMSTAATPAQRRGMRALIIGQCLGCLGSLTFTNGLLLLFLAKLGFSGPQPLLLLLLPQLAMPVFLLPLAHVAERGRRAMLLQGSWICALGFLLIGTSSWGIWRGAAAIPVLGGLLVYSIGGTLFNAPWYAVIGSVVPAHMRGSFFGTLRWSWSLTGLAFGIGSTFLLGSGHGQGPLVRHPLEWILLTAGLCMAGRVLCMRQVPELDPPVVDGPRLPVALGQVVRIPGYAGFCCYVFLLTLVTANATAILPLLERDAAGFSDRTVVWMGNLMAVGSVLGFWLGGRLVDRIGTRPMFLICHGVFAVMFFAVLVRDLVPCPAGIWLGSLSALFGLANAGSSVSMSTEMLALVPHANKSLSTALCTCLQLAGTGISGLFSYEGVHLGILSEHWQLFGAALSAYDSLILLNGVLVVLFVVTLGLVPSVMARRS